MIHRAVEISGQGRRLRKERGFLVVADGQQDLGRLPLDDLEVVLFAGHGLSCTSELMHALAQRCVPLILCDQRFVPASVLWPVESHRYQSPRIRAQAGLSLPRQKRLWQQLVRAKIRGQNAVLAECTGQASPRLARLAREVRSGDTANAEGEAARVYWPLLFGPGFKRDRDRAGVNALLNYGYTCLRAAVARAVMLAGLHPAFALHHRSQRDTMPLVDDLIEPFRPVVDLLAYALASAHEDSVPPLDALAKAKLAAAADIDMLYQGVASPVSECLLRMTRSLASVCLGDAGELALPEGLRAARGEPAG